MAGGFGLHLRIVLRFVLVGGHVADRFEQPARVEPIDPPERREFDGLEIAPRALALNHFGLEEADDRFGEHSPITIESLTYRVLLGTLLCASGTRVLRIRRRHPLRPPMHG